jgi:L-threonylcarbamoyladenylate synthase
LAQAFLPGPLTLLLPKESEISDLVTAGSAQVAIRVPAHPMARDLLERLNFPLAAPSANPFGYVSPTIAKHVAEQLGNRIPYILDGGPCQIGLESTIVDFSEERPTVIRKGGISIEALEEVVGPVNIKTSDISQLQATGVIKGQYAPRIPLRVGHIKDMLQSVNPDRVGILSYDMAFAEVKAQRQILLSRNHDLFEAGRRFFAALRYLDSLDIDMILAEYLPDEGLGRAVNDRLRRASGV